MNMPDNDIVLAIVSTTLLVLLLVSVLLMVFAMSARQRLQKENELNQVRLAFEKELRQVETEVTEQIMSQFAQELHDNIGQLLTATHIQIENAKLNEPGLTPTFKPIEIYLSEVTQQLRLLSRTHNGDYIGHIGLVAALQIEIERIKALHRFQVHWTLKEGNSCLDRNQELMVFRIFQEISQNILRHAMANNVFIDLSLSDREFRLSVRDDGKGFNLEEILKSHKASGVRNIMKRAKLAGIACSITSTPGNGCVVVLIKNVV